MEFPQVEMILKIETPRVEKEHIGNVDIFRAVDDYKLPFDKIDINLDDVLFFF
jgi:hypothetical protein